MLFLLSSDEAVSAATYRFEHEWPARLQTELSDPSTHVSLLPPNFQIVPFHYRQRESLAPIYDFVETTRASSGNFVPTSSKELDAIAGQVGLSAGERLEQTKTFQQTKARIEELEKKLAEERAQWQQRLTTMEADLEARRRDGQTSQVGSYIISPRSPLHQFVPRFPIFCALLTLHCLLRCSVPLGLPLFSPFCLLCHFLSGCFHGWIVAGYNLCSTSRSESLTKVCQSQPFISSLIALSLFIFLVLLCFLPNWLNIKLKCFFEVNLLKLFMFVTVVVSFLILFWNLDDHTFFSFRWLRDYVISISASSLSHDSFVGTDCSSSSSPCFYWSF